MNWFPLFNKLIIVSLHVIFLRKCVEELNMSYQLRYDVVSHPRKAETDKLYCLVYLVCQSTKYAV
jgi:hypothetical protein